MLRLLKAKMRHCSLQQTSKAARLALVLALVPIAIGVAQAQTETTLAVSQELTAERLRDMRSAVLERRANLGKQRGQIIDARLIKSFERALLADTDIFFDELKRPKARALRISCSEENWDACLGLAEMYEAGDGTWPDERLAFAFHIAGCFARDPSSCRQVWWNWRLEAAAGRYEGHTPYVEVIEDTCASGDGESCLRLSLGAQYGTHGFSEDQSQADRLLNIACDLGSKDACDRLPKTDAQKAEQYRTDCDTGRTFSCYLLGTVMFAGQGADKDAEAGEALVRESCVSGVSSACEWMFKTFALNTRDQITLLEQGCQSAPGKICNKASDFLKACLNTLKTMRVWRHCALWHVSRVMAFASAQSGSE